MMGIRERSGCQNRTLTVSKNPADRYGNATILLNVLFDFNSDGVGRDRRPRTKSLSETSVRRVVC